MKIRILTNAFWATVDISGIKCADCIKSLKERVNCDCEVMALFTLTFSKSVLLPAFKYSIGQTQYCAGASFHLCSADLKPITSRYWRWHRTACWCPSVMYLPIPLPALQEGRGHCIVVTLTMAIIVKKNKNNSNKVTFRLYIPPCQTGLSNKTGDY